jgi:ERCC4-type nuclease
MTDSIPATHIATNASSNPTSGEEYQLNPTYDLDHYDIIHRCFDLELSSRTACLIFSVNKFVADQTAMRLRIKAFHNTPYQFKMLILVHESTNLNTLSSSNQSSSLTRNQQHNSHPSHIHQKHEDVTHADNNQSTTTNNLEVILNDLNILCLANDLRFILTFDFREAARYIETVTILEQETKNGTRNMSVLVDYLRTAAIGAATTASKRPQFVTTTTSALPTGLLINDNSNTKQHAISILSSLPTLSPNIIESLISHFGTFRSIVTNLPHLTKAESVGAKRQQTIQDLFNCNFADVIAAREAQSGTAVHHP